MNIQDFIEKFAEAVEVDSAEDLNENTKFRELDEWSSLAVLSVIAMLDEEYDTQIENADFKKLQTISDIVQFIECQK
ncbi:acyl carrier protein [Bacteroides cellulosilyticus CL02T12C19]|jgi:acyl carrier protein|uniref:Acyl carrier protein n=1 Tax=Bacteroides cellulosilyticus CL02T12C19 TaxID=997874 RepID=I8VPX9_9BACE|nr:MULTISPECIES: phosphopantetheine-binding protein [Bacteroides]EIY28465.1 acyl carrier protein [Bacteroides cellulosilyticus CL02T12C19]MBS6239599.1 acyl carrier protein [Bacteroides sp.]